MPAVREDLRGFIVHAYVDLRRDRLFLTGRLEDGRSFAAAEERWRPSLLVYGTDIERVRALLGALVLEAPPSPLVSFDGAQGLRELHFSRYADRSAAARRIAEADIPSPDGDAKPADLFLLERGIRGPVRIRGESRPGRLVDLVFPSPELFPAEPDFRAPLRLASIDIETEVLRDTVTANGNADGIADRIADAEEYDNDRGGTRGDTSGRPIRSGAIRAVAIAVASVSGGSMEGIVRVVDPNRGGARQHSPDASSIPDLQAGGSASTDQAAGGALDAQAALSALTEPIFHPDEASLLRAFAEDLRRFDPDLLTGWNFLDFDFPRLAERFEACGLPFFLGRSTEAARFLPGEGRRSAAALVPGRQVMDALRAVRSGPEKFSDYTLETVARAVLGEGKLVAETGEDKIAELDRLYRDDPVAFASYCYKDAELVLRILEKTGLFRLALERSALMGVSLDKAWTSVAGFERVYAAELRKRSTAPAAFSLSRTVSGAAGGTVLEPQGGLYKNLGVFDFRSLYPTIIRTFNIDPLAYEQAGAQAGSDPTADPAAAGSRADLIRAPNGAQFLREPGILPALIADYFAARRAALDSGDQTAAYVYKILMNSFYGVLGAGTCRYGRTELAGAITSFARKWLLESRDWFTAKGYPVLYGDTDSLFVQLGLDDSASYEDFIGLGAGLAAQLNNVLAERIKDEYGLASHLELRFEKPYRRFLIPPLRSGSDDGQGGQRGRAKGYAGYILRPDGSAELEVKGMEAVRSDATPLARRAQLELLELVFSGKGEEAFHARVASLAKMLASGALDDELIYRKRLTRPVESYIHSTPPQVKAARALGWSGRRGTVAYYWTVSGPEPAALRRSPLDYDHYLDAQLLPVALSIAAACGWKAEGLLRKGAARGNAARGYADAGQMDLFPMG